MKGIQFGKQLEEIGPARLWNLEDTSRSEMILHIALLDNARDHMQHLANGEVFLTYLWALLSHACWDFSKRGTEFG